MKLIHEKIWKFIRFTFNFLFASSSVLLSSLPSSEIVPRPLHRGCITFFLVLLRNHFNSDQTKSRASGVSNVLLVSGESSFLISQVSIDGVISRNLLLKWKFLKLCSLLLISQQWRDAEGFAFHGTAVHNEIHQARVASVNADASGRHSLVRLSKLRKNSTE